MDMNFGDPDSAIERNPACREWLVDLLEQKLGFRLEGGTDSKSRPWPWQEKPDMILELIASPRCRITGLQNGYAGWEAAPVPIYITAMGETDKVCFNQAA